MHLELTCNSANAQVFVRLLDLFADQDVQLIFGRQGQTDFFDVFCKNTIMHLKLATVFNSTNVQSSSAFSIQLSPQQLSEHSKRMKGNAMTVLLRHIPNKSPELVFSYYNDDTQLFQDRLVSTYVQQVNLRKGTMYQGIEDQIKSYIDCIDAFTAQTGEKKPVPMILPRQAFFKFIPINEQDLLKISLIVSEGKRVLTFEQDNAMNTEFTSVAPASMPECASRISLRPADFQWGYEMIYFVRNVLGGAFGAMMNFNEDMAQFELRNADEWVNVRTDAALE